VSAAFTSVTIKSMFNKVVTNKINTVSFTFIFTKNTTLGIKSTHSISLVMLTFSYNKKNYKPTKH
jgi:hypothetical protein